MKFTQDELLIALANACCPSESFGWRVMTGGTHRGCKVKWESTDGIAVYGTVDFRVTGERPDALPLSAKVWAMIATDGGVRVVDPRIMYETATASASGSTLVVFDATSTPQEDPLAYLFQ